MNNLIEQFQLAGASKIHVLADFDKTLTKAFVDGKPTPSLISILRDGNYLTPDYAEKAHALFNKYNVFENDQAIPLIERKVLMEEWWRAHFELLINCGLKKSDVEKAVNSGQIRLRDGAKEFFDLLKNNNIPIVIMSASGLGREAIEAFLKNVNLLTDNVHIIGNEFIWDENGQAVAIKEPIIHSLNKDETMLADFPAYEKIKNRRNVILMGDNIGDIGMVTGFEYDRLLKIGFLNSDVEKNTDIYRENFDVVITDDGSLDEVNEMVKKNYEISEIRKFK